MHGVMLFILEAASQGCILLGLCKEELNVTLLLGQRGDAFQ